MSLEPQVAAFLLKQLKNVGSELLNWAEEKLKTDINGDGKIGGQNAFN